MPVDAPGLEAFPWSAMSRHFARFIGQLAQASRPELELAAALVSHAAEQGHICFDISRPQAVAETLETDSPLVVPDAGAWRQALLQTPVVGRPGEFAPLILDARSRLYLYRFWRHQQYLADELRRRAQAAVDDLDPALLRDGIARLFGRAEGAGARPDWQRVAAVTALHHSFCLISGGPGTGKTSTVVKILTLLLEQGGSAPLHIALTAPTGKAAARLVEAIRGALAALPVSDDVRARIPQEAQTLHRLLGFSGRSGTFRHHGANPLPYDVVIVDEASMVDLSLMASLVAALAPESRLILLGDRDQLASVEAGAVLGDLCGPLRENRFSPGFCARIEEISGDRVPAVAGDEGAALDDVVVLLQKSYRFAAESAIGTLSRAVNAGAGEEALSALRDPDRAELHWRATPAPADLEAALAAILLPFFRRLLQAPSPVEALGLLEESRILCALRRGPYGVDNLNRLARSVLARHGLVRGATPFYRGRPIMVTGNDYGSGLFNGDVGLVWPDPEANNALRAYFPQPGGGLRKLSPARLPAHETVFAMTVHKSQGSEFDQVLLLLPERMSEVLSRELVYTAMTRARKSLEIWGEDEVFRQAIDRRIVRHSGLEDLLWGSAGE